MKPKAPIDYSQCKTVFAVTSAVYNAQPFYMRHHSWDNTYNPHVTPEQLVDVLNDAGKDLDSDIGQFVVYNPKDKQ